MRSGTVLHPRSPSSPLPSADWRRALPEARRRRLRRWLWSGAGLTFLILVVGGITRLTQSGLSIVDWDPIVGVVPPLSHAEWQEAFARYRQFPEYQKLRQGMTLGEFQFIFFWEYLHRLLARAIGLVFLVPFLVFWRRGYFSPPLLRRVLVLFALGALQGFMGWFMVKSGLVDDPRVSHFRLAAHLGIALAIFGYCLWLVRELSVGPAALRAAEGRPPAALARWLYALGALLALQILWGAFVAGLDAGLLYNTFPEMGGRLIPGTAWQLQPVLLNLVENPATVQWMHRLLGTALLLASLGFVLSVRGAGVDARALRPGRAFALLVVAQYALGVATLLLVVPVALGVLHQALAVVMLGVWLVWLHRVRVHALSAAAAAP